jgi:hypothetical protein
MATRKTRVQIDTTADTSGAKEAAKALGGVEKAAEKANKTQEKGSEKAATGNKKLTNSLGGVSLQIQDVAVQAQMGTDAVRILGQQGPQIASVFGPTGAIAGAAIGLGAILVDALVDNWLGELERGTEAAKELYEKLASDLEKAIGENAARAVRAFGKELEEQAHVFGVLNQAQLDAIDHTNARAELEAKVKEAVRQTTIEQIKLLEATGQITDAKERIAAIEAESRAAADAEKIAAAERQIAKSVTERAQGFEEIALLTDQIEQSQAKITEHEKQQSIIGDTLVKQRRKAQARGDEAVERFEASPATRQMSAEMQGLADNIAAERDRQQELNNQIGQVTALMDQQAGAIDNQQAALDILKQGIAQLGEQREIQNSLKDAVQSQSDLVSELNTGVKDFSAQSEIQKDAVSKIKQAASDAVITAQDSREIGANFQTLMSTLNANQLGTLQELQRLQTMVNDYGRQLANLKSGNKSVDKTNIK